MSDLSTPLDSASAKLSSAFARLQKAVDGAADRPQSEDASGAMESSHRMEMTALQSENLQLRSENQALYSQLETLRAELEDVQERNDSIAFKIDQQVEQLELMA